VQTDGVVRVATGRWQAFSASSPAGSRREPRR
jgi:hypothetical protein